MCVRQLGSRVDDGVRGWWRQERRLVDRRLPDGILKRFRHAALDEAKVLAKDLRRNNTVASGPEYQISGARPFFRLRLELGIDQDVTVQRDTDHAASSPYRSSKGTRSADL